MYGNDDGSIPATYQILYMIGWKPSDNQVKETLNFVAMISWNTTPTVARQTLHSLVAFLL